MTDSADNFPPWIFDQDNVLVVPAILPATLVSLLRKKNIDPEPLLKKSGINETDLLHSEQKISLLSYTRLCDLLTQNKSLYRLPLELGEMLNISSFFDYGQLILSGKTISDAITIATDNIALSGMPLSIRLHSKGALAQLSFYGPMREIIPSYIYNSAMETCISAWLSTAKSILGDMHNVAMVHFSQQEPKHRSYYDEFFGCPVLFDQDSDGYFFDAKLLSKALPKSLHSEILNPIPAHKNIKSTQALKNTPLQLSDYLSKHLSNSPSLEQAAKHFGISGRTLNRQLKQLDLSYLRVLAELKKLHALNLMRDQSYSFEAIAHATGYSDLASFRKAFKGWTGNNPSTVRQSLLAKIK